MRILQLAGYFFPEKAASIYLEENRFETFGKVGLYTLIYTPTPCRGISVTERKTYKNRKHEIMYNGTLEVCRCTLCRTLNDPDCTCQKACSHCEAHSPPHSDPPNCTPPQSSPPAPPSPLCSS